MVADVKQVQSVINITVEQTRIVRAAVGTMRNMATVFQELGLVLTGTPLAGHGQELLTALTALETAANAQIWNTLDTAYVATHRGAALEAGS